MKLYMHPVSMTSRPVRLFIAENNIPVEEQVVDLFTGERLFIAENNIPVEEQVVDLFTGEHYKEPYQSINPNHMVPVLEDGDFRLTESSAILKYLADKTDSAAYPKDLKRRAKVNEMMDWLNTNFYRDYAYGFIYPQVFPHHKRQSDEIHSATIEWGKERAQGWLGLLDQHWIGPSKPYLTGDQITIADYFGSGLVTLGEVIRCNFAGYPNIQRWLGNVKKLKSWPKVNEVFYGLVESVKEQKFNAI